MAPIDQLKEIRLKKLKKLQSLGLNPYPPTVLRKETTVEARTKLGQNVSITGRIIGIRGHGKLIFCDLLDFTGKIQIAFKKDILNKESFALLEYLDVGDFLSVQGKVGKTIALEITVFVVDFQIISKSLLPLPDKWHGLKDIEERYRKRYIDMLLNTEVSERLKKRSKIIQAIRDFLTKQGFLEVETPTLQPVYGGGFARPFKTHHNALDADFYLRISDEMYLKRLIVGGLEKVFEITKVFRNEGIDQDHNPEFTMFEAQIAYEDYKYGMDLIEEIIENAAHTVLGLTKFKYQGIEMDVKRPWARFRLVEAVEKFTGVDPLSFKSLDEAKTAVKKMGLKTEKYKDLDRFSSIGEVTAYIFEEFVEEKLIQPTIIYDYPIEVSPLAKKSSDLRFTQRFEMFAYGSELGNNYTELNDPVDLRKRFIEEKKREDAGFVEAHQTDLDYLEAIEHGFPPTCGLGVGIDRLVMLLTDAKNIKEVIAFPTLRPIQTEEKGSAITYIHKPEYFHISPSVKEVFPSVSVGMAFIKGVKITKKSLELEKDLKATLGLYSGLTTEQIGRYTEIMSYRTLYKKMGIDWHSRRPSPEALLRRIALNKGLYNVNTCVDSYNQIVIKNRISVGAFDADKVEFPTELKFPGQNDEILLLGDEEPTKYTPQELAYFDKKGGYNIDFNYRDAQRTKVTETTKNLWINVDGIFNITPLMVEKSLKEGVERILKYCGGKVEFMGVVV